MARRGLRATTGCWLATGLLALAVSGPAAATGTSDAATDESPVAAALDRIEAVVREIRALSQGRAGPKPPDASADPMVLPANPPGSSSAASQSACGDLVALKVRQRRWDESFARNLRTVGRSLEVVNREVGPLRGILLSGSESLACLMQPEKEIQSLLDGLDEQSVGAMRDEVRNLADCGMLFLADVEAHKSALNEGTVAPGPLEIPRLRRNQEWLVDMLAKLREQEQHVEVAWSKERRLAVELREFLAQAGLLCGPDSR